MAFKIVLRIKCLRIEIKCIFLIWCGKSDQALHACPSRISDEEEVRDPPKFETREDEAGPSTTGASASRPRKLQAKRPRAHLLSRQRRVAAMRTASVWVRFLTTILPGELERRLSLQS